MMTVAAFRSEWVKLRRRTLLFGTFGGLAAAASIFSILIFSQAAAHGVGSSDLPSMSTLAQPGGLLHGLNRAIVLLGTVAFGIGASQVASEYTLGTLRQLLVRQPRRRVLLSGKYLGIVSFLAAAVLFAAVITGGVSVLMAEARHIPVSAWFSATGMGDLFRALGELLLSAVGFATLGVTVGLFLRSPVVAVIVGFAWLVPLENILARILPGSTPWLPGQVLTALGQGGTATISFAHALVVSALYVVAAVALGLLTFARRDVTA